MLAAALAAFLLGIRHGADPDHIAAIDNLARGSAFSRGGSFVGTLFAGGHSLMILVIAALIALIGGRLAFGAHLEIAGTWLSVVVLFVMAAINIRRLCANAPSLSMSLRNRLASLLFRSDGHPLTALPVGFLFGLGFETPTQLAAYVVMLSSGPRGLLIVGGAFCLGMIVTDTCDSILTARLIRAPRAARSGRLWLWSVTIAAVVVACAELASLVGAHVPVGDLQLSGIIVGGLIATYVLTQILAANPAVVAANRR